MMGLYSFLLKAAVDTKAISVNHQQGRCSWENRNNKLNVYKRLYLKEPIWYSSALTLKNKVLEQM